VVVALQLEALQLAVVQPEDRMRIASELLASLDGPPDADWDEAQHFGLDDILRPNDLRRPA
jgi:hypothetical protein